VTFRVDEIPRPCASSCRKTFPFEVVVSRQNAAVVCMLLALPGCAAQSDGIDPRVGVTCFVQLRRDVLGLSKDLPSSPDEYLHNGRSVGILGKITRLSDRWVVVVTKSNEEFWVLRDVILCVMQRPNGGDFGGPFDAEATPEPSAKK
jgi:hypothetical protein